MTKLAEIENRVDQMIPLTFSEKKWLIARVKRLELRLEWCIEGFEGTYGKSFWESSLGQRIKKDEHES